MTPERAKYILENSSFGEFRYAFPRDYCYQGGMIHEDGITKEEDEYIRKVWGTMPGHTSYSSAVCRIAHGVA